MTEWKSIRIPKDDFEHHNEKRQELGLTWAEYIASMEPDLPSLEPEEWVVNFDPDDIRGFPVNYDRIREIVREETRQVLEEVAR